MSRSPIAEALPDNAPAVKTSTNLERNDDRLSVLHLGSLRASLLALEFTVTSHHG